MHDVPAECFVVTPLGNVVKIKRGEMGYYVIPPSLCGLADIDKVNEGMGCSKAQREAMLAGSMWGWEVPAANPDMYDADGNIDRDKIIKSLNF